LYSARNLGFKNLKSSTSFGGCANEGKCRKLIQLQAFFRTSNCRAAPRARNRTGWKRRLLNSSTHKFRRACKSKRVPKTLVGLSTFFRIQADCRAAPRVTREFYSGVGLSIFSAQVRRVSEAETGPKYEINRFWQQ